MITLTLDPVSYTHLISSLPSVLTWIDELVDTNLDISTAKPLEVPSPVTLIVLSGLVIAVSYTHLSCLNSS